jgi:hypothetical protein
VPVADSGANSAAVAQPKAPFAVVDGKEVPVPPIPMGDPATIARIIDEGKNRNQVMQHLTHLSKNIGTRLTGSTNVRIANEWCRDQYVAWGLANPRLEKWGELGVGFDRGPSKGVVLMPDDVRPRRRPAAGGAGAGADAAAQPTPEMRVVREMQFSTLAWTAGTNGPVRGPVVWMPKTEDEYQANRAKYKGAWILMEPPPPIGQRGIRSRLGAAYGQRVDARKRVKEGEKPESLTLAQRLIFDGVAGYISTSRDERVWTGTWRGDDAKPAFSDIKIDEVPPDVHVVVRLSDYDYLNSRLADNEDVSVEFDLKHTFIPGPIPVYNTIAEIRGTEKPEEVVIISAHLDTWDGPGSQGTTDNGTGTAVTLEAARILMAAGAKPKRTIRFIHWTGEEQGLLGSEAWVKANKDEWPRISCCFVDDGGTNYQGGTPAPEQMVEMLAAATAPTNGVFFDTVDNKYLNVNIRKVTGRRIPGGGSSDHASFNAVGIPGFYWDEVGRADYGYGWHTQHDKIDLAIPIYLEQSATNSAITAYNLACAPAMMPRAERPTEPTPPGSRPSEPVPAKPGEPAPATAAPSPPAQR